MKPQGEYWNYKSRGSRLERYVALEMDKRATEFRCQGGGDKELRRRLAQETKRIAAALPEHLSSAGYKLVRGTDGLTATVLTQLRDLHSPVTDEMRGAGIPAGLGDGADVAQEVKALGATLARLCRPNVRPDGRGSRGFAEDPAGLEAAALIAYPGLRKWGETASPSDIPAGRLRTESALRTACELVVTYERAIRWLDDSWIIRMTPSRWGERMAAIVHDGFGAALLNWANLALEDPEVEISLPVSVTGKQIFYRPDTDDVASALTPENLRNTEGLGWIGCNVTARFEGLTFRNCDLRSTLFKDCHFRDVTFEDCRTDGLLFLACTFEGHVGFRYSGAADARDWSQAVKTMTFGAGCTAVDGELSFEDLGGYGVFLDDFTGPWRIERCSFTHMIVKGRGAGTGAGPGHVIDSPQLHHLSVSGKVDGGLVIEGADSLQFLDAPDISVTYR